MHLHWLDWTIIAGVLLGLTGCALYLKRYSRSVVDYMAGGRCAGRYLLTIGDGAAGVGALTMVAFYEQFYHSGFPGLWWSNLQLATVAILGLTGWIVYRLRQTKALTLAQFFELRYSRRFRVASGALIWLASILNYGIFPGVTARFVIYFFGLPKHTVDIFGWELNLTLAAVMIGMLSLAIVFTYLGGQIVILVTDFIQGSLINITFLIIGFFLFWKVGIGQIIDTLLAAPAGHSMLNPFDQTEVKGFNLSFFMITWLLLAYQHKLWQGTSQGSNSSAKSPHESRMATILGGWRAQVTFFAYLLIPIAVYAVMHSPDQFPGIAESVNHSMAAAGDQYKGSQMLVPSALSQLLPVGLTGLMCTVILVAALSTDDTLLLTYGSIFIQDVIAPFKKKPLSPEQRIRWIRWSVVGTAAFAFLFSLFFPVVDYVLMYCQITGAVYMSWAGAIVIGGLYWRRGTTAGAWTAMGIGSFLALAGVLVRNVLWPRLIPGIQEAYAHAAWIQKLPAEFPLNGVQMTLAVALCAVVAYVVVSLCTKPDPDFEMDRMLHRGRYAAETEVRNPASSYWLWRILAIGKEFTTGDKVIYLTRLAWILFFGGTVIIVSGYAVLVHPPEDAFWLNWWIFQTIALVVVSLVITVWFICGGILDLKAMLRMMASAKRNERDDGTVHGHQNWADEEGNKGNKLTE
ncbi:MAG: sodium:solute symporter [Verrucomicrobiota bacterium JB024]|nr:sodium:solute symporter [Verrucomicrobiota bacterium JB024]